MKDKTPGGVVHFCKLWKSASSQCFIFVDERLIPLRARCKFCEQLTAELDFLRVNFCTLDRCKAMSKEDYGYSLSCNICTSSDNFIPER